MITRLIFEILLTIALGIIAISQVTPPIFKQYISLIVIMVVISQIILNVFDFSEKKSGNQKIEKILLILESGNQPSEKWEEFVLIEKASWLPVGIKAFLMRCESSSGVIKGEIKIKDTDTTCSFSTDIHNKIPTAIENRWLPSRGEYQHFPIIEYRITEKTDKNAMLNIVIIGLQLN